MRNLPIMLYRQTKTSNGEGGFIEQLDYPVQLFVNSIRYDNNTVKFSTMINEIFLDNIVIINNSQYRISKINKNGTLYNSIEADKVSRPIGIKQPEPEKVWVLSDGVQVVSEGVPVYVWKYNGDYYFSDPLL